MKKFLAIAAIAVAFASCEEKKAETPATDATTPVVETPATPAVDTTKKADTTAIVAPSKMEAVKGAVTDAVKDGAAKATDAVKEGVKDAANKAVDAVKK
jgi:PBP1b-binding outer membrane lipoprotein LpoB